MTVVYNVSIASLEKGCDSSRFPAFWEFTLTNRLIKISYIGTQMRLAYSRISLADILSRPVALDLFNLLMSENTLLHQLDEYGDIYLCK